jgi:hypothetical protein
MGVLHRPSSDLVDMCMYVSDYSLVACGTKSTRLGILLMYSLNLLLDPYQKEVRRAYGTRSEANSVSDT